MMNGMMNGPSLPNAKLTEKPNDLIKVGQASIVITNISEKLVFIKNLDKNSTISFMWKILDRLRMNVMTFNNIIEFFFPN